MDLLMLDPVSEDQLSLFVIFVGSGSTILDVDCGSIFIGSIVVGFIVTGSESFVIGSVLNFGCRISLSLKIHSVLWLYAPVNWGVGSVFQLQKIHIYFEDSTSIVLLIFCRYSQPQCKIVPPSKLTL